MVKPDAKVQPGGRRRFVGVLVVIGVVGVGALAWALSQSRGGAITVDPAIPAGAAEGYLLGKADAPVQVIEFGDFECPACGQFAMVTEPDIRERLVNTGTVAFRFYDFPLPMHRNTWAASIAAGCAAEQGKFWEMHDQLYAHQDEWNSEATANPRKPMRRYASDIGLDVGKWDSCVDTQHPVPRIKGNQLEGERRRIRGTPTFIIGSKMPEAGPIGYDQFKAYVDSALAENTKGKGDSARTGGPAKKAGTATKNGQ